MRKIELFFFHVCENGSNYMAQQTAAAAAAAAAVGLKQWVQHYPQPPFS